MSMVQSKSRVSTTPIYELLIALFVMTLIVSNISSVKLASVGSIVFDAGTILFPLAYIVGDVITEVYGFRKLRRILTISVGMLLVTSITFWVVGMLPPAEGWTSQAAYDSILGVVWRIALASVIAIFFGELVNAYVLARMKYRTKGRQLWSRLIGSSFVGNFVDTIIFSTIAFVGTVPLVTLLSLMVSVFVIKMLVEIAISPLTIIVIDYIKRRDNIDIYEKPELLA